MAKEVIAEREAKHNAYFYHFEKFAEEIQQYEEEHAVTMHFIEFIGFEECIEDFYQVDLYLMLDAIDEYEEQLLKRVQDGEVDLSFSTGWRIGKYLADLKAKISKELYS